VLLTADGLDDRTRYLNARNTLLRLLDYGAIPIINENDTVSVDELQTTFGDNDRLAAMVTNLIRAPLLVLLSDVDGLYDRDPRSPEAKIIPTVTNVNQDILALAVDETTGHSKGGMASKLHAAKVCAVSGENTIIASGRNPHVLQQILSGEAVGTLFLASGATVPSWKRWIGFTAQPRGHLILDPGACRAITSNGSSLLAIGVVDVVGDFIKGDIVGLRSKEGRELARGLTNYSAGELSQIKGLHSDAITATLGCCPYASIIHRDNLVLTG